MKSAFIKIMTSMNSITIAKYFYIIYNNWFMFCLATAKIKKKAFTTNHKWFCKS